MRYQLYLTVSGSGEMRQMRRNFFSTLDEARECVKEFDELFHIWEKAGCPPITGEVWTYGPEGGDNTTWERIVQ